MASFADQHVQSGNLIRLIAGGKIIGLAQNASAEVQYGTTGVYGLGSIMPQEHVYLKYEGTVTLEHMRLRVSNSKGAIKNNGLISAGLGALGEDILNRGIINVVIQDQYSGEIVASYHGCTAQSYSLSTRANEILTETIVFTYLSANTTATANNTKSRVTANFDNASATHKLWG